jgi:hypothetical protein
MTHSDGGKGSARRPGTITDDAWERTFGRAPVEPDEDDEDEICTGCSGSGEGMYDGSSCRKCHGSGVEPVEKDDEP